MKDNLGNVRVSFDNNAGAARVIQEDEYYAFGLDTTIYASGTKNNYLYNGKELQEVLSKEYDYGARFYDPVIGRWHVVDPSSEQGGQESLTQYQYGMNNPIRYDDPDGRCPTCPGFGVAKAWVAVKNWVNSPTTPLQKFTGAYYVESMTSGRSSNAPATQGEFLSVAIGYGISRGLGHMPGSMKSNRLPARGMTEAPEAHPVGRSANTEEVPAGFPNEASVVRGGIATPEKIKASIGQHPEGPIGFSSETGVLSIAELSQGIPHKQIGVTTVGDIRSWGGNVIKTSGRSPNHATVTGLTPEAATKLLTPPIKNPNKE